MRVPPWSYVKDQDPDIYKLIESELSRQELSIELIASENFASESVISVMGSVLTNKYAEGLPGKRYYGGCEIVDEIETIAISRAKLLFSAKYANVQPHSGAQANAAVYQALAKPGDTILGLDLSHGGHLTHGSKVNFSGQIYKSTAYQLDLKTDRLDYQKIHDIASRIKPKIIIAGASAYPRIIDFQAFRKIADDVHAFLVVDMAHIAGLVCSGHHPSPLPYADVVTSTTHKTLRGPRGGLVLWNRSDLTARINKGVFPGLQGGPLEHIIAAKALAFREAATPEFIRYQQRVIDNARVFAEKLIEQDFQLVSGGTDNHLVLLSLVDDHLSGKQLEDALGKVGITVNKNTVPREQRSPFVTSGVRFGTPAVTTRGMGTEEMAKIAYWVRQAYVYCNQEEKLLSLKEEVLALVRKFPLYPEWSSPV